MPETLDLSDPEFTAQMQGLVQEATQVIQERAASSRHEEVERDATKEPQERALRAYQTLPQMLQPFVSGLEAISRATGENTQILKKLEQATSESIEPLKTLPHLVSELHAIVDRKDTLSRQMFDALHEELKTYKDGFLLESVHRPMIRDLISLYDDLSEIHRSMEAALKEYLESCTQRGVERLRSIEIHIAHNLEFVLEVLARLEVVQLPVGTGKLDKKFQRAVAVEVAEDPDRDFEVVRTVKRGFLWKDRVVRAEEVVIKKWSEGYLVALQPLK